MKNCLLRAGREQKEIDADDTAAVVQRLVEIRRAAGKAAWFSSLSAWKIARSDGKNAEQRSTLCGEIVAAAHQRASDEFTSIQAVIDKQQGGFSAQPWDWATYAEQVRRREIRYSMKRSSSLLELNTVLNEERI
ncbi:M3 family metallopeptidase [Shigella flexneri]